MLTEMYSRKETLKKITRSAKGSVAAGSEGTEKEPAQNRSSTRRVSGGVVLNCDPKIIQRRMKCHTCSCFDIPVVKSKSHCEKRKRRPHRR